MVVLEVFQIFLQLHELRFTKGSPISTSVEQDQRAMYAIRLIADLFAPLIWEGKFRYGLTDFRALGKFLGIRIAGVWEFLSHTRSPLESNSRMNIPKVLA